MSDVAVGGAPFSVKKQLDTLSAVMLAFGRAAASK